jgi:hypothetical protein
LKNVILDELVLNQVVAKTMKEILEVENVLKDTSNTVGCEPAE